MTRAEPPDLYRVHRSKERWVPNLADGVSIWRLAPDLNHPDCFAGSLIEPSTEGPDNLPTSVEWDVTGLSPLSAASEQARRDFLERLERALALFETKAYARFANAFTVPSFEADDGANYYFDAARGCLRVINWGASPRRGGASSDRVIGYRAIRTFVAAERRRVSLAPSARRTETPPPRRWGSPIVGILLLLSIVGVAIAVWVSLDTRVTPPERETLIAEADAAMSDAGRAEMFLQPPPIPPVHQTIRFALGTDALDEAQRTSLDAVRAYLDTNQNVTVLLIEGHADDVGDERDNLRLSRARARTVRAWLIDRGVAEDRLSISGCSELYPSNIGSRRVEFYVLDPTPTSGPHLRAGCIGGIL